MSIELTIKDGRLHVALVEWDHQGVYTVSSDSISLWKLKEAIDKAEKEVK
jgi:hypothetical protein